MNKPHKFKHGSNGTSTYDHLIYCEYCGHVSFYANREDNSDGQKKGKEPCSNAIDATEVTGD